MLNQRWLTLWKKLGAATAPDLAPVLETFAAPNRYFHSVDQLTAQLAVYDRNPMQDPVAELAIWTHDVIHEPLRYDNEEASFARCAVWFASHMPATHLDVLHGLILATRADAQPLWIAAQVVVDVDLAWLGGEVLLFVANEQRLRHEYAACDDAIWRKMRLDTMSRLLTRPRIYRTAWFHDQFETAARRNLIQGIQRLNVPMRAE